MSEDNNSASSSVDLSTQIVQLKEDISRIGDSVQELISSMAAGGKNEAKGETLQSRLKLNEARGIAMRKKEAVDKYVHEQPWVAALAALGIGLAIGKVVGKIGCCLDCSEECCNHHN